MSKDPERKPVKVGVRAGGGPPPGYLWNVEILDQAFDEAMSVVDYDEDEYAHLAMQVRELATQAEPSISDTVDVRPIEDYFEIRDKGGVLGKKNVRVFFFVNKTLKDRAIVVLGTIKKENNGQTPVGVKITMRRRKRLYLESRKHDAEQ